MQIDTGEDRIDLLSDRIIGCALMVLRAGKPRRETKGIVQAL